MNELRGSFEYPDEVRVGDHRPTGIPVAPYAVNAVNREGFYDLARICQVNGIILLIRLAPVFAGNAPENSDAILAWREDLENAYPNTIVVRPEILLFEEQFFYDKTHCNRNERKSLPTLSPLT
jgi:hypothetical protein